MSLPPGVAPLLVHDIDRIPWLLLLDAYRILTQAAILLQYSAQARHWRAQSWQCSWWCLLHSSAHAIQIFAQTAHIALAWLLSSDISSAAA
jgi:hypothetical protein